MSSSTSPENENPADKLRRSQYHDEFLGHNQRTRNLDGARRLLDMEWRYLGPLLEGTPQPRVLDLACGSGTQTIAWAERGARVVGIDFDHALLDIARTYAREQGREMSAGPPQWSAGDATRLPFADGSFDVVFCNSLLEHVPAWEAVLAETSRVLAPGGVVVVYTTNKHCPLQQEVNHFPFYSWLPGSVKTRVMAWIMKNRRDMVNYTDFPAVNWFSFPGMRDAFESYGITPLDRIDLAARSRPGGLKGAVVRLMAGGFKWPYYFYAISMAMYGVRRART